MGCGGVRIFPNAPAGAITQVLGQSDQNGQLVTYKHAKQAKGETSFSRGALSILTSRITLLKTVDGHSPCMCSLADPRMDKNVGVLHERQQKLSDAVQALVTASTSVTSGTTPSRLQTLQTKLLSKSLL